ncbi:MAG: glycogen/starch/alpha-glucan phosphorylase, partial [Oscillospiraceae bacterium]|nr:glycogen/starch/alpha-glucan phosphorylase [Oscillospiraceae bacterium]
MSYTKIEMKKAILDKLSLSLGTKPEMAMESDMMRACALVLRDVMALREMQTTNDKRMANKRKVHYLSLEFLMGRSLMKNACNLGVLEAMSEALEELGFKAGDVFEAEPDAGLGNGGLGRLAACYLDSMTTLEIPASGYSICYDLGIFRQKIVEGQQVELPDEWRDIGGSWLIEKPVEAQEVHFGGRIREFWDRGQHHVVHED